MILTLPEDMDKALSLRFGRHLVKCERKNDEIIPTPLQNLCDAFEGMGFDVVIDPNETYAEVVISDPMDDVYLSDFVLRWNV